MATRASRTEVNQSCTRSPMPLSGDHGYSPQDRGWWLRYYERTIRWRSTQTRTACPFIFCRVPALVVYREMERSREIVRLSVPRFAILLRRACDLRPANGDLPPYEEGDDDG
jgi:hypothetical protein